MTAAGIGEPALRRTLENSTLFRDLPPMLLDQLARCASHCSFGEGEALFFKHDPGDFLALVTSGCVYKVLYGPDGQELIVGTAGSGEIVDETVLLERSERSFTAVARAETTVVKLARRHFHLLVSEPLVLQRACASLCMRLQQTLDMLEDMCLHRLESRLARHLLRQPVEDARQSPIRGSAVEIVLPPTQSILAAMVNASRPKLNAQLQLWHRSGLIQHRRTSLRINDMDEFRCRAYLRPDSRQITWRR